MLVVLLWVVYAVLVGAGGVWTFGIGVWAYLSFILAVWVIVNPVMSEISETLWD